MPYTDLQHLSATEFKRLCGVRRETFNEMVEVLRPQLERQGRRGGQKLAKSCTTKNGCVAKNEVMLG